jgi:hypothetical protein
MIVNGTVVLHNSMDFLKVEPDSCDDGEVIDVKVEEVTIKEEDVAVKEEDFEVVKEEEDPLLIRLPLTGTEHEVSYNSVCPLLSSQFANVQKCHVSFVCLSMHRKKFHAGRMICRKTRL